MSDVGVLFLPIFLYIDVFPHSWSHVSSIVISVNIAVVNAVALEALHQHRGKNDRHRRQTAPEMQAPETLAEGPAGDPQPVDSTN